MVRTPAASTSQVLLLSLWGLTSILFLACQTPACAEPDVDYRLDGNTEIGISFPELQDERGREITAEHLHELGVKTIRFDAPWHLREPERDTYNWSPMDRRMSFLEELGIRAILTFPADAPDWIREGLPDKQKNPRCVALDEAGREEFAQYVGDFLTRYRSQTPGVIAYVQFGNEWASDYNYVGSGEEFAATQRVFYQTVKSVMPDTPVVLGGFSVGQVGGMALIDGGVDWIWDDDGTKLTVNDFTDDEIRAFEDRIAAVLYDGHYDWIDFHLYDQYADWSAYFTALKRRVPDWFDGKYVVTEFGGPHPVAEKNLGDDCHAERVEAYIRSVDALPEIELALHFRLVQSPDALHSESGLMRRRLFQVRTLPAYEVFRAIVNP
jgi:hypothetical protein